MVRGRRMRSAKTGDEASYASPKRKDSRMENIGNLANGVTMADGECAKLPSPPTTRSRLHIQSKNTKLSNNSSLKTNRNSHITNYFQVVSPVNGFEHAADDSVTHSMYDDKSDLISNTLSSNGSCKDDDGFTEENEDCLTFGMGCYADITDFADITEIIHSNIPDRKKTILNNIFKKENCIIVCKESAVENDSAFDIEHKFKPECAVKLDSDNDDLEEDNKSLEDVIFVREERNNSDKINDMHTNVRLSPRKHASTMQRCVKENVMTPHRISLCETPASPSHALGQLSLRANRNRTRRRLHAKLSANAVTLDAVPIEPQDDKSLSSDVPLHCDDVKVCKTEVIQLGDFTVLKNGPHSQPTVVLENIKTKGILPKEMKDLSKTVNGGLSHKLTEYFPVRRSVRKTKKEVMEEKQRDLELAIKEEREDGLEVASFEGKGRGIIASRLFRRGDFVVEYAGELVSIAEARDREVRYAQDRNAGCYMYYFRHNNHQYCIDATSESGRLGRLVNHSRNGNLITKSVFLGSIPHLVLLANQDIRPGEEVTYDYGDRSKESLQHHPWLAL